MNPDPWAPLPPVPVDGLESIARAAWARIPILGWWLADLRWKRAAAPFRHMVHDHLIRRDSAPGQGFSDVETARIAARCAALVASEIGWPNDRFLPDDPAPTVFWAHEDGLDDTAAIMAIEAEWGIRIGDEEVVEWLSGDWQSFVGHVAVRIRPKEPGKTL